MKWTVSPRVEECGACHAEIPALDPLVSLAGGRLMRCPDCVDEPVDRGEVELERARLKFDEARRLQHRPAPVHSAEAFQQVRDIARRVDLARTKQRQEAVSRRVPVPFDGKARACGRDD